MSFLAFVGRLMFSFLFLSSGLQKLQTFNLDDGGVAMTIMKPRMDEAQRSFKQLTKVVIDKFQLPLEHKDLLPYVTLPAQYYPHALGVAIFLEVAGSLLFVLNRPIGAWMLVRVQAPGVVCARLHAHAVCCCCEHTLARRRCSS